MSKRVVKTENGERSIVWERPVKKPLPSGGWRRRWQSRCGCYRIEEPPTYNPRRCWRYLVIVYSACFNLPRGYWNVFGYHRTRQAAVAHCERHAAGEG